uniref:Uncharacterized protein n=1 Tax=Oryza glaberrima TaxID=4538 RepID=I1PS52_ORYGL
MSVHGTERLGTAQPAADGKEFGGGALHRVRPRRLPRSQPPLASKAKVLGRLAFPALLAEASDYIAALEMQVWCCRRRPLATRHGSDRRRPGYDGKCRGTRGGERGLAEWSSDSCPARRGLHAGRRGGPLQQRLQASSPRTPSAATTSATASRHPMSLFLYRLDHWAYPDRVCVHLRGVDIAARETHPPTRPSASPTPTPTSAFRRTPVPALLPPPRAHLWPPRSPAGLPPCFPTATVAAGRSYGATLLLSRLAPAASTPAAGRLAQKREEKRREEKS